MRILVIGGTSFIGPHVVRQLLERGAEVTVFHRGQTQAELSPAVKHIYGERRNLPAFVKEFETLAPEVVLDMFPYTEQDAQTLMQTFKGLARRVVGISSADVYRAFGRLLRLESGAVDPTPLGEDAPLRESRYPHRAHASGPEDWKYHYDKILVERALMNEPKLPCTILRLPAVYGPGDKQHRLFEYLKRMDDGRPVILLDKELSRWRWTRGYVENVAAAIALAATDERTANRIYNAGEREALSEKEWIENIGRAAGWKGEVVVLPKESLPEQNNVDYAHEPVTDTSRLRDELNYDEHVSRREALQRTIAWERKHPPAEVNPAQFDYAAEDEIIARHQQSKLN